MLFTQNGPYMQASHFTWCGADETAICGNERRDLAAVNLGEKGCLPSFG